MREASVFDIDPERLDRECLKQASLSRAAGEVEADARHANAQAKARLDVVAARLTLAIRNDPAKYRLRPKPTKEEVEAAVVLEPQYQEALKEVNQTQHDLDVAKADVAAHIDRRKMLERLVDLLQLNYFSEREPKPVTQEGRERIAHIKEQVAGGLEWDRRTRED
jgi:hypothetical protein